MDEKTKIIELNRLIEDLCEKDFSKNKEKISIWIQKLNKIYANDYRHTYSEIFSTIQKMISEDNSEKLEALGENLNVLGDEIKKQYENNSDDANLKATAYSFKKFSDHINLEIGRYNFIKSYFSKNKSVDSLQVPSDENLGDEVESIKGMLDGLSKDIDNMRPTIVRAESAVDKVDSKIEKIDSKLESNKISSLTTLTIFSAVVLSFSGGITFEAGIFKGMSEASPYRLIFTIALTGFILFNTIFVLLYLVSKLADKNIGAKCKYWSNNGSNSNLNICGNGFCNKQCHSSNVFCRIIHKYSYVAFVNIVLIWTMYIDFFLWVFKEQQINRIHILCQLIPVFLFMIIVVTNMIYQKVKMERMKLKFKLEVLKNIVLPDENTSIFSNFKKALSSALLGEKDITKQYVESIRGDDVIKAIEKLDTLAKEVIVLNKKSFLFISSKEHKLNKKQLEKYEELFADYIDSKNKSTN